MSYPRIMIRSRTAGQVPPAAPPDPARWTMNAWLAKLLPAAAFLALAAAPAPAAPTIKDEGHLFSDRAKDRGNALIADIEREFKKEVHVEAYNKPPANKAEEFAKNKGDAAFRDRFFRQWADER